MCELDTTYIFPEVQGFVDDNKLHLPSLRITENANERIFYSLVPEHVGGVQNVV